MAKHLTRGDDNYRVPEYIDPSFYNNTLLMSTVAPDNITYAGAGHDTVGGSSRNDLIYGEEGDDYIDGGGGYNNILGGTGNDTIFAGAQGSVLGEDGDDRIFGGDRDDRLFGGADNDILAGYGGHDLLVGEEGTDHLLGGDGNDSLFGGEGTDYLYGGNDSDQLNGGADDDRLIGGEGADVFVFIPGENSGVDIIEDFEVGVDKLRFFYLDNPEEQPGLSLIEPIIHDGKFSSRITFPFVEGSSQEAIIVVGVTPEQLASPENFHEAYKGNILINNPYDVTEEETSGVNTSDYSMLKKPEMEYSDEELGEAGGDADAAWVEVPSMDWSDRESELASQDQIPPAATTTQSDASFGDAEEPIGWSWSPPAPSISLPVSMVIFYPHVDDFAF